jgi:transcriptional regulator with XRE-family HTH domain
MGRTADDQTDPVRLDGGDCIAAARLGAELQGLRTRTGKSLKDLEELVHVSDSSMSRYLSGRIVAPWPVIERLSKLAGEDPYVLRPLWEHLVGDRHRQGRCEPEPFEALPARDEEPPRAWHRRNPGKAVAALTAGTAVVFGGLGLATGFELAPGPRVVPAVAQETPCRDWPWPSGPSGPQGQAAQGQAAIPPAKVHGQDHTPTVQLVTGTIGGRQMAWAQITGARYGDRVWMDWSQNGGVTWTQCGPFTTTTATFSSRAHPIGPAWRFRACGDTPRPAVPYPRNSCTGFW